MSDFKIIHTTDENVLQHGLCGYKNPKRPGFPEKIDWLKQRLKEGLVIKSIYSEEKGSQGMIEYVPGEFCWRPVSAKGYMFIHCLFVGFKRTCPVMLPLMPKDCSNSSVICRII